MRACLIAAVGVAAILLTLAWPADYAPPEPEPDLFEALYRLNHDRPAPYIFYIPEDSGVEYLCWRALP